MDRVWKLQYTLIDLMQVLRARPLRAEQLSESEYPFTLFYRTEFTQLLTSAVAKVCVCVCVCVCVFVCERESSLFFAHLRRRHALVYQFPQVIEFVRQHLLAPLTPTRRLRAPRSS